MSNESDCGVTFAHDPHVYRTPRGEVKACDGSTTKLKDAPHMETFTINADDLFTAHKPGCAHLHLAGNTFDITAPATRDAVRFELDAQGFEDSGLDFAPCLSHIR